MDRGVRKGSVDAGAQQRSGLVFDPEAGVGVGVKQQLLFELGGVVLQPTDGFVAERDALSGQLLVVGQQMALTDQQPPPMRPR